MAISKNTQTNIDDSNPTAYPNGQVKDNDGTGDGFPLIQVTTSDIFEFFDKLMRLAGLTFNSSFDNEVNGYQFVSAMIALAGKNDFVLALTTSGGVLQIPTATNILQLNEVLIAQASQDQGSETQIKGTGSGLLSIITTVPFKNGDYLLLRKTGGGITIIRMVTANNADAIVSALSYLKAASNAATLTGTSATQAVTPASLLYALTRYLTVDANASPFYATDSDPGLMSAADKTALDGFTSPVKNVGWIDGFDPGGGTVGASYGMGGDVTANVTTSVEPTASPYGGSTTVTITIANAMADTNYMVRCFLESTGTITLDNNMGCPVFAPLSTTTFAFSLQEMVAGVQSLKVHFEVVQLS